MAHRLATREWRRLVSEPQSRLGRRLAQCRRLQRIVRCFIQHLELYDHKRDHAHTNHRGLGKPFVEAQQVWDFVVECDDGTYEIFHPRVGQTKAECKSGLPEVAGPELPRSGPGGTNGPGTFKHFTQKQVEGVFGFDAKKTCKGKGKTM